MKDDTFFIFSMVFKSVLSASMIAIYASMIAMQVWLLSMITPLISPLLFHRADVSVSHVCKSQLLFLEEGETPYSLKKCVCKLHWDGLEFTISHLLKAQSWI